MLSVNNKLTCERMAVEGREKKELFHFSYVEIYLDFVLNFIFQMQADLTQQSWFHTIISTRTKPVGLNEYAWFWYVTLKWICFSCGSCRYEICKCDKYHIKEKCNMHN